MSTVFPLKNVSVLLVEDNKINQMLLRKMLENLGCRVSIAHHGIHALEKLCGEDHFDIVLTDIQMPVMNGFELAKSIRMSDDLTLATIPVLGLTGYADELDSIAARESGIQELLTKPFGQEEIMVVLISTLGISPNKT